MSVTNGTITLDPGSDRIIYNVSYGRDSNPFAPSDNGDTYSFEVLHQAKDPDFTKWDNRLFMEAIEFFGHAVLGIGEFNISSLDAEHSIPTKISMVSWSNLRRLMIMNCHINHANCLWFRPGCPYFDDQRRLIHGIEQERFNRIHTLKQDNRATCAEMVCDEAVKLKGRIFDPVDKRWSHPDEF